MVNKSQITYYMVSKNPKEFIRYSKNVFILLPPPLVLEMEPKVLRYARHINYLLL